MGFMPLTFSQGTPMEREEAMQDAMERAYLTGEPQVLCIDVFGGWHVFAWRDRHRCGWEVWEKVEPCGIVWD
jgi:hypothetical protein